ncbi:MAG: deoxyuridine 5'-triphosphate nucleotidohydrolase [Desulfurococcaceae archaeon TW002]
MVKTLITGYEILKYVRDLLDVDTQLQPAGIDLRVSQVFKFRGVGILGFDERRLPETEEVLPENGYWNLDQGVYKIRFAEVVELPRDVLALCFPRSSLLRSGVLVSCTVWDPGYVGRGEALMHVINPHGIKLGVGSRVVQLIFFKLNKAVEKAYEGFYKGENL